MRFVDITNDIAFRKIFGNENRKEALISFLNAVLLLQDAHQIVDVTILNPYQLPALKSGKVTIVDVKARDQSGRDYIVEMQVAKPDGFNKRVLYYAANSYSSQIERGDLYEKLNPVFFIGILDFSITKNTNYISRHLIVDVETGENLLSDIEFNFIELPKFNKKENELDTIIDQWIYFIKNAESLEVIPENVTDKGLKIAYQNAERYNWSKQELEAYNNIFIREQDDRGRMALAIREGIREGIQENKKEIATNLLKAGISVEIAAQSTGLTIAEVQRLQSQL